MATTSEGAGKPYLRLAKPEEYQQVVDVAVAAFIHDPALLYFGSVEPKEMTEHGLNDKKHAELRNFLQFLMNTTVQLGGRIVVVIDPTQKLEGGKDKIVAAAVWDPPNKRLEIHQLSLLLRSGVTSVWKGWGFSGLYRIAFEWMDNAHKILANNYNAKGIKKSPDDSWYLNIVMTDPSFQNRGCLSMLLREGFAHDPDATFSLDSTTANSRDRYIRHGFEVLDTIKLGEGKVSVTGLPATESSPADGVNLYVMVKWGTDVLPASE